MKTRDSVCLITSVISCCAKPLSYSACRSVFSPEERLIQTQKSIDSVRKYIPGCRVVLVEMGADTDLVYRLRGADLVLSVGNNRWVRWAANSRHKGLGEVAGLLAACEELDRHDYYFKLSGRYVLNEKFRLEDWAGDGFTVRLYDHAISTRLYGFSGNRFHEWNSALWWSIPWLALGRGMERELYRHLPPKVNALATLGLSGCVAPDGSELSE